MDPLPLLNQLGPWGIVIGVALVLLAQRFPGLAKLLPSLPTPAPTPAPQPGPSPLPAPLPNPAPFLPDRPVINVILSVLLGLAKARYPLLSEDEAATRYAADLLAKEKSPG